MYEFPKGDMLEPIDVPTLSPYYIREIKALEAAEAEIKAAKEQLREKLLSEMERKGIVKIENPELTVYYIAAGDRETFDSKALKKDDPGLYDRYARLTPYKASLRIKVKENV
ncbi:MAG: hypothetical protein II702_06670 [Clostridia bacterium]|nr:hypothetical protein [Clostridia bacterium]